MEKVGKEMTSMQLSRRHVGLKTLNSTHTIHKEELNAEHFSASETKQAGGKALDRGLNP